MVASVEHLPAEGRSLLDPQIRNFGSVKKRENHTNTAVFVSSLRRAMWRAFGNV